MKERLQALGEQRRPLSAPSERVGPPATRCPSWRKWMWGRVVAPLGIGAVSAAVSWAKDALAAVLLFPMLALVWGMFLLWCERPSSPQLDADRGLDRLRRNWHALSLLALLFLMAFEGGVAAMAEQQLGSVYGWLLLIAILFLPYMLLAAGAHAYLRRLAASIAPSGRSAECEPG